MSLFSCDRCSLGDMGTMAVQGDGPEDADLMIIGMNPGMTEARIGRPFVGASGQLLDRVLKDAGLDRREVYVTNTVKHRTPDNRAPLDFELKACAPYLERELEGVKPKVAVLLGAVAQSLYSLYKGLTATEANGTWRSHKGVLWVATFHPAYVLHRPEMEEEILKVFVEAKRMLDG